MHDWFKISNSVLIKKSLERDFVKLVVNYLDEDSHLII